MSGRTKWFVATTSERHWGGGESIKEWCNKRKAAVISAWEMTAAVATVKGWNILFHEIRISYFTRYEFLLLRRQGAQRGLCRDSSTLGLKQSATKER